MPAYAQRHRFSELLAPTGTLGLCQPAFVAVAKADHLHPVVFVQQNLGVTQILPIQLHAHGERVAKQVLAEFGRHAFALLQQAGQLARREAGRLR